MGACPCKHGDLPQDVEDAAARLSEMLSSNGLQGFRVKAFGSRVWGLRFGVKGLDTMIIRYNKLFP